MGKMRFNFLKREKPEAAPTIEIPAPSLRDFCAGDEELYDALEYFLLLEPREKSATFGTVMGWFEQGDLEKERGNSLTAMVAYECAARIACYENDKETTRKALALADSMNPKPKPASVHKTLLLNLDKVFEIARLYYKTEASKDEKELAKGSSIATVAPLSH
jgi:hypothetical protein